MAYSDAERAQAMIVLAKNKGDYTATAKETGVSRRTLIKWAKTAPKNTQTIPEMLEAAIVHMLASMPDTWSGKDWPIAMGILMDKWLLSSGKATERKENLTGFLQGLPEDDRNRVIAEAERILSEAASGSPASGE